MNKTFAFAGTTMYDDVTKVRFCNDLEQRLEILGKCGCTAMNFIELPNPMEKLEAVLFLKSHEDFQGEVEQAVINTAIIRRSRAKALELGLIEAKKPGRKSKAEVKTDDTPQFAPDAEEDTATEEAPETVAETPEEAPETTVKPLEVPEELIMAQPVRDANGMFLSRDKRIAMARAQMQAEAAAAEEPAEENAEMA